MPAIGKYQVRAPERERKDYSQEEQQRLRAEFTRSRASASTTLTSKAKWWSILGTLFLLGVLIFTSSTVLRIVLIFGFFALLSYLFATGVKDNVVCPGCKNLLRMPGLELGPYCPECGQKTLQPGSTTLGAAGSLCHGCGKTLKFDRSSGPNFDVNACSHCGLILVDRTPPAAQVA